MSKTLHRLTAAHLRNAGPGKTLNDGGGLYFRAATRGEGNWLFRFTSADPDYVARQVGKGSATRQREMGLGSFPGVSLARAREKAGAARAAVDAGRDPIEERRRAAEMAEAEAVAASRETMSFGRYAEEIFLPAMLPRFSNAAHIQQWRATFDTHAAELRDRPLTGIGREDVLAVLAPIWETKNPTATRIRERLERLFSHAIQNGEYTGDNPASWRQFDATLTPPRKLVRGHHAAIGYSEMPGLLSHVRSRQHGSMAAVMLEWIILSACRTGEARFAVWTEVDEERAVWTVPAERMKMRRAHSVPLTERMLDLLGTVRPFRRADPSGAEFLFPGQRGRPLSEMAVLMWLRKQKAYAGLTVHGFRSTFRTWAGERTEFPRELIEEQLAHQMGAVERAYMRGSTVDRRRALMEAWTEHCEQGRAREACPSPVGESRDDG